MSQFNNSEMNPQISNMFNTQYAPESVDRNVVSDTLDKLSPNDWKTLMDAINEYAYRSAGFGSMDYQYQQVFKGFEKYGRRNLPLNTVNHGYTFITRPKLNLSPGATKHDNILGLLMTTTPNSPLHAIRCLLDTKYCIAPKTRNYAMRCEMIDIKSPFIKLLTNCSRSHSGWPDLNAEPDTTEGGFFNEDQTAFLGYDELNRTYDLSIEFEDIQGGHVMALFVYWFLYMAQLKRGRLYPYAEDLDMRRLCYTCSIYRFLLDPSKRVIVAWAKATGCFPKSVPLGAMFNVNSGEVHVSSAQRFSIPFTANKIEYNTPLILTDFNTVTKRFHPNITEGLQAPINDVSYNFVGRPYVKVENGAYRLVWYYDKEEEPRNNVKNAIAAVRQQLEQIRENEQNAENRAINANATQNYNTPEMQAV